MFTNSYVSGVGMSINKFKPLTDFNSLVKYCSPSRALSVPGRPLWQNQNDPFQFDIFRQFRISRAEIMADASYRSKMCDYIPNSGRDLYSSRHFVSEINNTLPGYKGYIPRMAAENVHGNTRQRVVTISNNLRDY